MAGTIASVADFLEYNPPAVYDFSSCSEYAIAGQEYMSNKFSNVGLLLGLVVGGGVFMKTTLMHKI